MDAMGLTRRTEPCWVYDAEGDHGDPHFDSTAEARAVMNCSGAGSRASQRAEPCWELTCAQCQARFEDDEVGYVHFASVAEAAGYGYAAGWRPVAGRWLCACCFHAAGPDAGEAARWWAPPAAVHRAHQRRREVAP